MPTLCKPQASTADTAQVIAIPSNSVPIERRASGSRLPTMPTQAAQIGSRSGLTAIAPTIKIGLSVSTPIAAITAATAINAT
jgi:hypothetical protein